MLEQDNRNSVVSCMQSATLTEGQGRKTEENISTIKNPRKGDTNS